MLHGRKAFKAHPKLCRELLRQEVFFISEKINNLFLILFSLNNLSMADEKKAYFAGGCFWCVEEAFEQTSGVIKVKSGYTGGHVKNPTYEQVTYKNTGHYEAVVVYDPKKISYDQLLDIFENIDPYDAKGQFTIKDLVIYLQFSIKMMMRKNAFENSKKRLKSQMLLTLRHI